MAKKYKTWELYLCLALNRLVMELGIDLYQDNLEDKLDEILAKFGSEGRGKVPKSEISYEIKSNYQMTNKILQKLEGMELIEIEKDERSYNIMITKKGVLYIRKFNEFYISMYEDIIRDHYRYRPIPAWFKE
jgi:predicted transcriptional regulator